MKKEFNMLQIKILGFICIIMLNVAWSGIIRLDGLCFVLGFLGSAGISLFLFAMMEKLKHTVKLTGYMLKLLALSAVSAFPYYIVYCSENARLSTYLPSSFTLFFCVGAITIYDRLKQKSLRIFSVIFFCIVSFIFGVEWVRTRLYLRI